MKKTTKWALLAAATSTAAIAVSAVISGKISRYVVDSALNRENPKPIRGFKKPGGDIVPHEFSEELAIRSEALKKSPLETVEITATDGEKLVGHWYACPNAKRVIIAMHGWRSAWYKDFCGISGFWQSNGCSVLYAEQRGQGESGGAHMGFGMTERFDCANWVTWAISKTEGKLPVYLAGISMGASTVLMAGGSPLPDQVKGIMADCGFTSAHDIWKHVVEESTPLSYNLHSRAVDRICKEKIRFGTKDYTTLDALKSCMVPVIFFHGTDDSFVPVEMTYENYKACAAPKRLYIVPGATHAMSYMVDTEGYESAVLSFWSEFDK